MMGRRPFSEKEMQAKLLQKHYAEEEVAETMARLNELGYLNDAKFASERVRSRAELYGWGAQRIKQELKQKGVDSATVTQAVEAFEEGNADEGKDPHDWQQKADDLLARKFGVWPEELMPDPDESYDWEAKQQHMKEVQKEKQRRLNFLIRRGFSYEQAQQALSKQL